MSQFVLSFPKSATFELVVRSPGTPLKRHVGTRKQLLDPDNLAALRKASAEGATCRGGPISRDMFVVSPLTEQQIEALQGIELPIFAILQTGTHCYAAWLRDPYQPELGPLGEPSTRLRKILRVLGEIDIRQTADIPGFAVARKPGVGSAFVCKQFRLTPTAVKNKVASQTIDTHQKPVESEPDQSVPPARMRP